MRKRTKMNGLVSHTTPSGASYQSGRNRCEQQIKRLQKLIDDGYEIIGVKKKDAPFKLFGTFEIEIPVEVLKAAGFCK